MIVLKNGMLLLTPRPGSGQAAARIREREIGEQIDDWQAVQAGLAALDERIALAGDRCQRCRFTLQRMQFRLEWTPCGQLSWGRHLLARLRCLLLRHHGRLVLRVAGEEGRGPPPRDAAARACIRKVIRAAARVRRRRQFPRTGTPEPPGLHCPDVERVFGEPARQPYWRWLRLHRARA
ncbi:hypothetical protein [Cupriavidus sp. AU9028]|uniref:hypothetical protein n=1 Tax=Cupriavidus sp. AU9028 TaxID=2871157 RepID=UPI001C98D156|nr:hypothetical protein [Cupriavidus sp. AU9028]MBY4898001.1 hypothetical protein [Cupriavidus sp. AU9028]